MNKMLCAIIVVLVMWWEARQLGAMYGLVDLSGSHPVMASQRGDQMMELRQFTAAISHYERSVQLDRFRASYHRRLGEARLANGDERGMEDLQRARELNPTRVEESFRHR